MDGETLATLGVLSNNGMTVANWGMDGYFRSTIHDLIEIICQLQIELDISVTLINTEINIETGICTFKDIKVKLTQNQDLESRLQLEQEIKTRLVQEYLEPVLQ